VDPDPNPLLLRKSGSAGNQTRTSGSVARNLTTRPQRRSQINKLIIIITIIVIIVEYEF
jgi:hypothetical protein